MVSDERQIYVFKFKVLKPERLRKQKGKEDDKEPKLH
jgi:hypothetical protein